MLDVYAQQIIDLYYADYQVFFSKPNVVGIAYGYKVTNGINTCKPSIHVFVEKKVSASCLPKNCLIPSSYKRVQTDVIEAGKFVTKNSLSVNNQLISNRANNYTGRVRPIQPGWSISSDFSIYPCSNEITGTLGYLVTDNEQISKTYCLLSINGAFADWNNYPTEGEILQPSYEYGGRSPQDVVAKLLRYTPLTFRTVNAPPPPLSEMNIIDASIASFLVTPPVQLINPFIPPNNVIPRGIASPQIGMAISWTGCFNENQSGNIISINAILKANYSSPAHRARACWFKDVSLVSEGFFSEDDVGALAYNNENKAIGLLFTESSNHMAMAICSISSIQDILKVTLLT